MAGSKGFHGERERAFSLGTLDKPYPRKRELVTYYWSGKHQKLVKRIALLTLLWTDGKALIPCEFRVYDCPLSGQTNKDHFRALPQMAKERGFQPEYVLRDSRYSGLKSLPLADLSLRGSKATAWP